MARWNIHRWSTVSLTLFAGLAAFGTYFSMYAFRKPFAATDYAAAQAIGDQLDFKIAIVIAQVLGYAASKFLGIKVIAELRPGTRYRLLLGLVGMAWLALLGFGLAEGSAWSIVWLFLNGLPLGMIWGIVFSYLEGRQTTEVLGAILCTSFIIASGAVKSVGSWLILSMGVSEYWMPFWTGALFLPGLVIGGWLLEQVPSPTQADILARTERRPMSRAQRIAFVRHYALGLLALIICYIGVTIYRDFRDNFAVELWSALGYADTPSVFTLAEIPIAVLTLVMLALTMFIRDNKVAFRWYLRMLLAGAILIGASTWLFQHQLLGGASWMVLVGAGLYTIYIPFNAILFERLIAALGNVANVGFLIYLADAWGYAGSVLTLLYKNFGQANLSWLAFFLNLSYVMAAICGLSVLLAYYYFHRRWKNTY